jgi:hypothetical protein
MRRLAKALFCSLLLCAGCGRAVAQAWVPEKGDGSISTSYNFIFFRGHFTSEGKKVPEAAARAQSAVFQVEYGVTNKLALSVSLPIVAVRYASNNPPSPFLQGLFAQTLQSVGPNFYRHGFLDDGSYHATLQDIHVNVRYNVLSRPLVITPFVTLVAPSHDYAYVGEAAPGRNLWEVQFGSSVGRTLDPFLRRAYVEAQFSFAVPEQSLNVRTTRVNIPVEFGYFLTRRIAVRGLGSWQHTYRGLRFPVDLTTPQLDLTHERLLKANYWHAGGGVSYALNHKTEISADVVTFLSGSNTHYGTGLSMRISRNFKWRNVLGLRPSLLLNNF